MSTLTFRNRMGSLIDIPAVAASEAKNSFGAILDQASRRGAVAITRHDATRAVLVSVEEFEALVAGQQSSLSSLGAEFDGLLARMQTPKARQGIVKAFAATPGELGKAAVLGARKKR